MRAGWLFVAAIATLSTLASPAAGQSKQPPPKNSPPTAKSKPQPQKKSAPKKSQKSSRKKPTSAPASQAAAPQWPDADITTVAGVLERLPKVPVRTLTDRDLVLHAGLRFCDALARGDAAAADFLDAVGYQSLPASGELPEHPEKPLLPDAFRTQIKQREPAAIGDVHLKRFAVQDHRAIAMAFPAVASWMLPAQDYALIIDPDPSTPGWVEGRCCIVVRIRGKRATVMGGTLPLHSPNAPAPSLDVPSAPASPPKKPPRELG